MSNFKINNQDVMEWAASYSEPQFHCLLTDCPYEQEFMNKKWDSTGVAFDPETWKALTNHLLPGAFIFVMAGTLNNDLISVAMRNAGLRKYHQMMGWAYGSGFPKATRIDTAIDRTAGAKQRMTGTRRVGVSNYGSGDFVAEGEKWKPITQPHTPLAQTWAGHRYGGQMLKPAIESILIFQKPCDGRPIDSITTTGAGALNIDAGRIDADTRPLRVGINRERKFSGDFKQGSYANGSTDQGRWPANFILLDEEAARRLDQQSNGKKLVDSRIFLQYGALKENHLCKEIASNADLAFLRGQMTLSAGLENSVAENVLALVMENLAERTHGVISVSRMGDGIESGEKQVAERYIRSWKIDGCGNDIKGLYQRATKYTTLTKIQLITNCQTCNSSVRMTINIYTGDGENIILLSQTELLHASVNDAENTNRLLISQSVLPEPITDIAKIAKANTNENGEQRIQRINKHIFANGESGEGSNPSRFFFTVQEQIDEADPIFYCAKPDRGERDEGLDRLPVQTFNRVNAGGIENDPRWAPTQVKNNHPTVKPIALAKYLASLLLPPDQYAPRRILIPFCGSGSEMIGALLAGFEYVEAIEKESEYAELAEARVAYWWRKSEGELFLRAEEEEKERQGELFGETA